LPQNYLTDMAWHAVEYREPAAGWTWRGSLADERLHLGRCRKVDLVWCDV